MDGEKKMDGEEVDTANERERKLGEKKKEERRKRRVRGGEWEETTEEGIEDAVEEKEERDV